MGFWQPTRRELLGTAPLLLGSAALPHPVWAQGLSPLRFFVLGDWGRKGAHSQVPVAREMARVAADRGGTLSFVLTTGDNFYDYGVTGMNDPHWRKSFDDIYAPTLLGVPWHPVLGNHDWGGDVQAQVRRQDRRWRMKDLWYKLDARDHGHPDVEIFMIDTMIWGKSEHWFYALNGSRVPRSYRAPQREWLTGELERSSAPVRIVVGHHPVYSVGPRGVTKQLCDLDELMKRTGVTLYICGHDHFLSHIRQGDFHYVCSGGGSEIKAGQSPAWRAGHLIPVECPVPAQAGEPARWESFHPNPGFASFEADSSAIRFRFHAPNGNGVLHQATLPVRRASP